MKKRAKKRLDRPNVHLETDAFKSEVSRIFKENKVNAVIECGTNDGLGSTKIWAEQGAPVHTCEVRKSNYEKAIENTRHFDNVFCNHAFTTIKTDGDRLLWHELRERGDSPEKDQWLEEQLHKCSESIQKDESLVVFLDSHWTMGMNEFFVLFSFWYFKKPDYKIILVLDDATNAKHRGSLRYLILFEEELSIKTKERWAVIELDPRDKEK